MKNRLRSFENLNIAEQTESLKQHVTLIQDVERALALSPKRRFLFFWYRETPERDAIRQKLSALYLEKSTLSSELEVNKQRADKLAEEIAKLQKQAAQVAKIKADFATNGTFVASQHYWTGDPDKIQKQLPNNSQELQDARAKLFIAAIRLRKAFVVNTKNQMINSWKIVYKQNKLSLPRECGILKAAFQITQVLIPVMSTTLASVQSMFRDFGENTIDNVVVDESGQATPASVVGLMWRAKRFLAVGDPAQIEPVVTVNEATLRIIGRRYAVSEDYMLPTESVQRLADQGSVYGTATAAGSWIGIPLWVHQRCASPMFEIANEISYDNRMVQGGAANTNQVSRWIDVGGTATDAQFVPAQVEELASLIKARVCEDTTLADIFVISPFNAVVDQTKLELLKKQLPGNAETVSKWTKSNIGTVHTFQGKEANIVYFVIGTDAETDGSADWAFSKPNLLNVAATRAKKEFYVIGDRQRLRNKNYIDVADRLMQ